jgi:hypothetical protein
MLKKSVLGLIALACMFVVFTPSKAHAGVSFGINVGPVVPAPYVVAPPYGYVPVPVNPYAFPATPYAVPATPYVAVPSPYVAITPGYVYPSPGAVFIGGRWFPRVPVYRIAPPRRLYWRR